LQNGIIGKSNSKLENIKHLVVYLVNKFFLTTNVNIMLRVRINYWTSLYPTPPPELSSQLFSPLFGEELFVKQPEKISTQGKKNSIKIYYST